VGCVFDLVHIDGNHDTEVVTKDVELYLPRLNRKGFIILDDISWDSVKLTYQVLATRL
jgi:predicted O-methyltransferase YrrM